MSLPGFNQIPTYISNIRIRLIDTDGVPANMRAYYEVEVEDQDHIIMQFPGMVGDLVPHLTPEQVSMLMNFMQEMRALAEQSFIP